MNSEKQEAGGRIYRNSIREGKEGCIYVCVCVRACARACMHVLGVFEGTEEFHMVCNREGDHGNVRIWGQMLQ